jgi:hypothetical protein
MFVPDPQRVQTRLNSGARTANSRWVLPSSDLTASPAVLILITQVECV